MSEPLIQSMLCPVLIGRDTHVATITRLLDRARTGQGEVVLISGEAGIGKSRLVAEAKQLAVARGFATLQTACFEQERALPYAPLLDLVRMAQPATPLSPELAALIAGQRANPHADGEQAKRRLLEALAGFLLPLTPSDPAKPALIVPRLLVFDDLHWCDEATLEFLHFLLRKLAPLPAILLVAFRHDEITLGLGHWLTAVARTRAVTEIKLTPLTKLEIGEMVRAIFQLPRTSQSDFVDAIHQLTDGNPFFVEEVLKSCVADGSIFQLGGQWGRKPLSQLQIPRTVQLAVQQRLTQLTPAAANLLTLAAVIGQRWSFDLLRQVAGLDERTLITLLKECVAAQLLVEEAPDLFAFRHALTRQAVYHTLLGRERRLHHAAIATCIEATTPATAAGRNATLAYHFAAAGVWDKTLTYARQAGEEAQQFHAPSAVVEHFTCALMAANELGLPIAASLLRGRGQAYEMLGNFAAALDDFNAVLAAMDAGAEQKLRWQILLDLGFLWTSRDFGRAGDYFQQALTLARSLDQPTTLAHTLNRIGNWHVNMDQPQEGRIYHAEALTLFQTLGDQAGVAATLDLLAGAVLFGGDLPQGIALYRQAAELFRTLGNRRSQSSSLSWLAFQCATALNLSVTLASPDECVQFGAEALQIAREIQWRPGEAFAMIGLAFAHGALGEYGQALTLADEALAITQELQHSWATVARIALGTLYLELGDFPTAQQQLESAVALSRQWNIGIGIHNATSFLALTQVQQGAVSVAQSLLTNTFGNPPLAQIDDPDALTLKQRLYWLVCAELALQQADLATAMHIVRGVLAAAQRTATESALVVARLWLLRGRLELASDQPELAIATLQQAHHLAEQQGARPLLWRIDALLGQLYTRRHAHLQAEQHFAAARQMIETLAATLDGPTARGRFLSYALAQLPAPLPVTPLRAAKAAFDGLTEREREVALLIVQGKSDRQIAQALVLSKRTVSTHVTNILNKLGFSSRTQIAAWAVEKGLLDR